MNESTYIVIAVASGTILQQHKKFRLKVLLAVGEMICSVTLCQWVANHLPRPRVKGQISTGASSFLVPSKTSTHILWHSHCCLTILWYGNRTFVPLHNDVESVWEPTPTVITTTCWAPFLVQQSCPSSLRKMAAQSELCYSGSSLLRGIPRSVHLISLDCLPLCVPCPSV